MIANLLDEKVMVEMGKTFSGISISIVFQNFLVIAVVIGVYVGLTKISPFFKWSLWSLFASKEEGSSDLQTDHGTNIHILPAYIKYFGLVFLVLVLINVPYFARFEEEMFREGLTSWEIGIWVSIGFGLAHCLVGVPIGAGLGISIAGIWFTHQYFVGGVDLSTIHHSAYNLILFSVLLVLLTIKHVVDLMQPKRA